MRKKLVVVMALAAMGVFSAVSASGAQAGWNVEGAPLGAGASEAVAETVEVQKPFVLSEIQFKVSCGSLALNKALITGPGSFSLNFVEFKGCTVLSPGGQPTNCVVKSVGNTVGNIRTVALKGNLFGGGLEPREGLGLFDMVIEKGPEKSCSSSGTTHILGSMGFQVQYGTNAPTVAVVGSGTGMNYGERHITFSGEGNLRLTSGKSWGASL